MAQSTAQGGHWNYQRQVVINLSACKISTDTNFNKNQINRFKSKKSDLNQNQIFLIFKKNHDFFATLSTVKSVFKLRDTSRNCPYMTGVPSSQVSQHGGYGTCYSVKMSPDQRVSSRRSVLWRQVLLYTLFSASIEECILGTEWWVNPFLPEYI